MASIAVFKTGNTCQCHCKVWGRSHTLMTSRKKNGIITKKL